SKHHEMQRFLAEIKARARHVDQIKQEATSSSRWRRTSRVQHGRWSNRTERKKSSEPRKRASGTKPTWRPRRLWRKMQPRLQRNERQPKLRPRRGLSSPGS
ncbi:hypothetical protein BGZ68_002532, partial [Mortierella alpina]